jgi:uncharacterized protein (TIGR02217 family)
VRAATDDRLSRDPVSGQHRLWRHRRARVRDHGGGDRRGAREAQRQLVRGARPLGCRERAQEAAQIDELIAFFRARRGKAYGFRFKDWTDYKATGQPIGTGDGTNKTFQLVKRYPSGSVIEVRTITKPVAGTVRAYKDAAEQLAGWSVDVTTGIVTFTTAPAGGVAITADFELDVPVRFDTDHMAVTIESFKLHRWQQIPIVELRS